MTGNYKVAGALGEIYKSHGVNVDSLAVQADDDQSTHDVQAACMAKVIGSYIEKTGTATPDAGAAAAAPAADDTAVDPVKPTTALTTCPDGSAPVAGNCMR